MKKTPIIRVDGSRSKDDELKCMDCGKPIEHLREAPSGSMLPRCEKCNAKRWSQYWKECQDPHSSVGKYPEYDWDDPWEY